MTKSSLSIASNYMLSMNFLFYSFWNWEQYFQHILFYTESLPINKYFDFAFL